MTLTPTLERMFPLGIVVKEEIETDEVEGKQIYMKFGSFITYLQFYLT